MDKPIFKYTFYILSLFLSFQLQGIFISENIEVNEVQVKETSLSSVLIEAEINGSFPLENAGYCQTGQRTITFTNKGENNNPVTSIITNVSLGVALGNNFALQDGGFQITGIQIAGIDLLNISPLNQLDGNPLFTTDPDGAGGLDDLDNDGFFDDLGLNESVDITVIFEFDCTAAGNVDPPGLCLNNFETSFSAQINYENQGENETFELADFFSPSNKNVSFENFSDPDAYLELDTFFITHLESRTIRLFESDCNGNGQIIINITLPNGVSFIDHLSSFTKNDNIPVSLLSSQINNGIVTLTYDASNFNFLSGDYTLKLAFTTDCFAANGPSVFPVTLEHYCPDCDCRHIWYCDNVNGPYFHPTLPPCPLEVIPLCPTGVKTTSFEVNRTTFGFQDEGFTIPFDPALANSKVALGCDLVQMKVAGVVGEAPISDSLGLVINYGNPDGSDSPQAVFLFDIGNLRIQSNGSEFNCPVASDAVSLTDVNGFKTMTFDLHECVADIGIPIVEGDSIEFIGNFSINPDGPFPTNFKSIPDFRAFLYADIDGEKTSCDSFGEFFTLGRSRVFYDFPNSLPEFPVGCEIGELHYRLFILDNQFSVFFGSELREATKVDSIVFDFDPVLTDFYENVSVKVSIPGHPIFWG